jgi:hypothetical protein
MRPHTKETPTSNTSAAAIATENGARRASARAHAGAAPRLVRKIASSHSKIRDAAEREKRMVR